ncbi:P-loop containing nucleoside triphosphate hydrolase protein [Hyaloscypha bicolor E]|uniref:P-loop containing nucleoside triphosphate hydrolase protein n=1 Tax=Hyaloscypha bicolor E TaxID=1095630 RepID=A0A2J6ST48_9HELO|nr:P-loop containing nucleoside triphosphate hydrolase protein [Hyaloscypha bicolor E]PMD53937.1 P-loop containing nucleoside triphosphate hydrolase protein [Hyaloscypha bicolor E]
MSDVEIRFADLQSRYTELLEKRIAQLEAAIAAPVIIPTPVAAAANGVEKEDDNDSCDDEKTKKDKADEQKKDEDKGPKSRYRSVVRKWNKEDGAYVDVDVSLDGKKAEDGEIAFTFRKKVVNFDQGDIRDANSEVDLEAEGLRNLVKEVIGTEYPGQNLEGETVNILAPYAPLVHNWEGLKKAAKPVEGEEGEKKQARADLVRLLECVEAAPELENYFKTRESNIKANITTYDTMWSIFKPRTKVVAKLFQNAFQIFEVALAPIPRFNRVPRRRSVSVWCWDWKGKGMTKVFYDINIDRYWGTKDISQLPCYPLEYYMDGSEKEIEILCKSLQDRGAKYNKIVRSPSGASQMYIYNGPALSERRSVVRKDSKDQENDNTNNDEEEPKTGDKRKTVMVKGPVIVDPEAFLQFGADYLILGESEPWFTGDWFGDQADEEKDHEPGPEEFLLYPPRILGYSTREKIWGQFSVDKTTDVPDPSMSLFKEKLQLDEDYKIMIQALVEEHGARGGQNDRLKVKDVVEDKGKGLVLLLHGPPGVGKTLTAETIAEATGKPLFIVSVAEIGLDASKAERNLEQMFYLAGKWEAVLLVDEADVFLESRTSESEPNRNALVSVLLRVLEYYDGIIILTTNRITSLDIAVQSRIHLAIRYEDLDQKQKQNVFRMFLRQLEENEPKSIKDYNKVLDFVDEYASRDKLNGRQIRNVVASALSLARSKAKRENGDARMTVDHLKKVLYITKDFQEQLESITTDARRHNEVRGSRR